MAEKQFPEKLIGSYRDDSKDDVMTKLCDDWRIRHKSNIARLKKGFIDAPYYGAAVSLGFENDSPGYIYRITVPGYFYRRRFTGEWTSEGRTGVLIASDPANLVNNSEGQKALRYLHSTGTDTLGTKNDHANNMCSILPGESTYAYFVRDTNISEANTRKELMFVPTVVGASLHIHPSNFAVKVGRAEVNLDLVDTQSSWVNNAIINASHVGNWYDSTFGNWRSMVGWWFMKEDKLKFIGNGQEELQRERHDWLVKEIGLSDAEASRIYGY